jgi:pimeloyl-ACP methyl ester carboxylesterase
MKTHYVQTTCLDIEFHEWNPSGSRTIVFLHGWPDSYRSWISLTPFFVRKGFRVLAPSLRGFSGTRFRDTNQPRSGQPSALGRDLIEFVDALNLSEPVVVGHDWGARAVAAAVGLAPNRFLAMVMISIGYGTNYPSLEFSMHQAKLYWYHWFLCTPIGGEVLSANRLDFSRELWRSWSPEIWFSEDEFIETARSFANDDWVDVVLHYYRYRWGLAKGNSQLEGDERFLREIPQVFIPSLVIHGSCDGVNPLISSEGKEAFFRSRYQRKVFPGIGHFPQREDPESTAQTILSFLNLN